MFAALAVSPARGQGRSLGIPPLLQREGYADVAIDYLDQLKADPNAPKEIMDLWDLEMSRSKKDAAKQAYSDAQAKQWTEESKALLEQFIKANPDRPEAIQEAARWSEEQAMEAQYAVLRATYATDKARRRPSLGQGPQDLRRNPAAVRRGRKGLGQTAADSLPPSRRTTTASERTPSSWWAKIA